MGTAGNAAAWRQISVATLQSVRGGGKRDRTADLLHAMQALSQLSYTPTANRKLYRPDAPLANLPRARYRIISIASVPRGRTSCRSRRFDSDIGSERSAWAFRQHTGGDDEIDSRR